MARRLPPVRTRRLGLAVLAAACGRDDDGGEAAPGGAPAGSSGPSWS